MTSTPTKQNDMTVKPDFRPLRPTDDMSVVAHLLFDTDPYIYEDLFSDIKTAEEVLPFLFARNTGVFNYQAYHVALLDGKIVGLSSLYKHNDKWDEASVRMAFAEAGKKLPPSFDAVSKYFVSVHNYTAETNACNICILSEMRRRGIGEFMLSNLIIMAGNSNITLTVLKSNTAAINLYQKHGFRVLYEFDDYGGYGRPTVKSYKMILLNSDV